MNIQNDTSTNQEAKKPIKKNILDVARIIYFENFSRTQVTRVPEPEMLMTNKDQVEAYDEAGAYGESFRSAYFFNILKLSKLVPNGGTLLDLACGSGQFLIEFKKARPDVRIIGVDLSDEMLTLARKNCKNLGLDIQFVKADITSYWPEVKVDCVSCVFALHHLPERNLFQKTLENINKMVEATDCNVWLFDLSRPRSEKTISIYPAAFSDSAKQEFKLDSQNSLRAAFNYEEFSEDLKKYLGSKAVCTKSAIIPLYICGYRAERLNSKKISISMSAEERFNTLFVKVMFSKVLNFLNKFNVLK